MTRRMIATAALSLLSVAGSANAVIFFDGVFAPSNWSVNTMTNLSGTGSTVTPTQNLFGGNPNEWREVQHSLSVGTGTGELVGVHLEASSFYTPSSQGAISFINYSEDAINLIDDRIVPGNGQGTGLAITQGGRNYILRPPSVMPYSGGFSSWGSINRPGIVATDMWEYSTAGGLVPTSNPDFSIAGSVMQFGFWRGNSGNSSYSTDCGIDNWRVEIVPTPGAATLMGLGALVAVRRRRAR
jgi:hypothetical protein